MRILHVHDFGALSNEVGTLLRSMVFSVDSVPSIEEATEILATNSYDVAIVDIDELPYECIEELPRLRSSDPSMQVIVCGSPTSLGDVTEAIEKGAQDFVLRPVRPLELRIRIMQAAALSAGSSSEALNVSFGSLQVVMATGEVLIDDAPLDLTPRERGVINSLIRARGNVVAKDQIAQRIFEIDVDASPKAIETYISRLRGKLRGSRMAIETVRGLGYRLVAEEAGASATLSDR